MGKWLAGIAASIIIGVTLFFLTGERGVLNRDEARTPTSVPSFLELLAGKYRFDAWNETRGQVTMGVKVKEGSLTIDSSGKADWDLGIWDSAARPQEPATAPSRVRCGGRVNSALQNLSWEPGADRNAAIDWERGIESVRAMVNAAFCGGSSAGGSAPFSLHVDASSGRTLLEMRNAEGVFIWIK